MNEKNSLILFSSASVIALLALAFVYTETTTGNAASSQQFYGKLMPHTVRSENPCKVVNCRSPYPQAYPSGVDDWGNVLCKCPGHAEVFYAVNPVRKY